MVGADAFIDEWLTQPMFVNLPFDAVERSSREGQHAEGLAASLREAGTGNQRWLGDDVAAISAPTLLLAGAFDEKFAREARELSAAIGTSAAALVPGAGHAAHLQQPQWCARVVQHFLNSSVHRDARSDEQNTEQ
jgi:2-succinyl-6-hydroxy-2,4-cyclohexadiene-1-carboxylate synthase